MGLERTKNQEIVLKKQVENDAIMGHGEIKQLEIVPEKSVERRNLVFSHNRHTKNNK